jgi:selenocysteine lyase/cysteine desulfurase
METAQSEFPLETTYLNTASMGIPPRSAADAMRQALDAWTAGRPSFDVYEPAVAAARSSFARITGTTADRVALSHTVTASVARIAAALPSGAEVLGVDGDFASVLNPFAMRADLRLRTVPLEKLADTVHAGTELVAVSAVQSADGRIADLAALREAAAGHGARLLIDASQAAGWLPLRTDDVDFVVCAGYKWLLGPFGVSYLAVREGAEDGVSTIQSSWYAAESPWDSCYGPVTALAASARRFDATPAFPLYVLASAAIAYVEKLGVAAVHAHDTALAARFRDGLRSLGHEPVPAEGSAIVAVPGLGQAAERLAAAEVRASARAGNLRLSFHLYNSEADVDRALDVISG